MEPVRGQDDRKRERHAMDGVWLPAGAVFFKIVVAYTRFKQPLFAPARVARAAPDLALPHR
jgi:hypothetical protein